MSELHQSLSLPAASRDKKEILYSNKPTEQSNRIKIDRFPYVSPSWSESCPFCPGHEAQTSQEIYSVRSNDA